MSQKAEKTLPQVKTNLSGWWTGGPLYEEEQESGTRGGKKIVSES